MIKLNSAIKLAIRCHSGQKRRDGQMYIFHPWRVMKRVKKAFPHDIDLHIMAILHDVVEDSEISIKNLKKYGFNKRIISGIESMTHRKKESYKKYIERLVKNEDAIIIKISDILDNFDTAKKEKVDVYKWAIEKLIDFPLKKV